MDCGPDMPNCVVKLTRFWKEKFISLIKNTKLDDGSPLYLNLNMSFSETKSKFSADSGLQTNFSQATLLAAWKLRNAILE